MRKFYILIFITFSFLNVYSQPYWAITNGPNDGDVLCLGYNPENNYFYAGLSDQDYFSTNGFFRSTNNGQSWAKTTLFNEIIYSIFVNNNIVYAGFGGGVRYSTNNGTNFTNIGLGTANCILARDNFILAGKSTGGLYRTTDSGANWNLVSLNNRFFGAISIDSSGKIFAGSEKGIYRSTNNGITFDSVFVSDSLCSSIAINISGEIFAAFPKSGIYKSTTGGNSWVNLNVPYQNIKKIVLKGNLLFASCSAGIITSTNSGANWSSSSSEIKDISCLVMSPALTILAGTNYGIQRSTNAGVNWSCSNFRQSVVYDLYSHSNGDVYATSRFLTNTYTTWKTTNNGNYWIRMAKMDTLIYTVSASDNGNVFIGTPNGLSRSTNGGNSFFITSLPNACNKILTLDSGIILANGAPGCYRSTNYGVTWDSVSILGHTVTAFAKKNNTTIYLGTSNGYIFKSTNKGLNWSVVYTSSSAISMISANSNGLVYASTSYMVKGSTNEGQTWNSYGNSLYATVLVCINNSNLLFININDDIYKSTNLGATFEDFSQGTYGNYTDLEITPDGNLFVSSDGTGVCKTINPTTSISSLSTQVSENFLVHQNYPNPFNPITNIYFEIPEKSHTKLKVYDALGKEIQVLVNESLQQGTYNYQWDASNFTSGVYFYRLEVNDLAETKKMILLK